MGDHMPTAGEDYLPLHEMSTDSKRTTCLPPHMVCEVHHTKSGYEQLESRSSPCRPTRSSTSPKRMRYDLFRPQFEAESPSGRSARSAFCRTRCRLSPPLWADSFLRSQASKHAAGERSAAPFSPQFCTCAPTAERRCPLGSVHAGEQPHRSRSATVSRSERSAQATRPPLAALATDLIASSISRPSASKLSMMDIVDREADAERPRGG